MGGTPAHEEISREDFLKKAGEITLKSVALGTLVSGPVVAADALFLPEDDAAEAKTRQTRNGKKILKAAHSYRGVRYKHGGHSRAGMDCDGLVRKAYGQALGVYVPADPNEIWRQGHKRKGAPYVGDILCYSEKYSRRFKGEITHVGIQDHGHNITHASNYWNEVCTKPHRWADCGYVGAVVFR